MKQISILVFLLAVMNVNAQRLAVEGRSWEYCVINDYDNFDYVRFLLRGDSVFDGRQCKVLYYSDGENESLSGFVYEDEDGNVNVYNTTSLKYAFFLHKGWKVTNNFEMCLGDTVAAQRYNGSILCDRQTYNVYKIDSIMVNETLRSRWYVTKNNYIPQNPTTFVVEGIGNNMSGLFANHELFIDGFPQYNFVACYDGDKCIFKKSDFKAVAYSTAMNNSSIEVNLGGMTLENLLADVQKPITSLTIKGKPQAEDYVYLSKEILAEVKQLDLKDADIDTIPSKMFYNCSSDARILLPAKVKHLADSALCVNHACCRITYELTGSSYPTLGIAVYSESPTVSVIKIIPTEGNDAFKVENGILYSADGTTAYHNNSVIGPEEDDDFAQSGWGLKDGVCVINGSYLENVSHFPSVYLPASVDSIGDRAFAGMYFGAITDGKNREMRLVCKATTPPRLGKDVFSGSHIVFNNVYVPTESVELYKAADGWKELRIVSMDKFVTNGIDGIEVRQSADSGVYDLQGRKITNATKGIYIRNGKKVVVK